MKNKAANVTKDIENTLTLIDNTIFALGEKGKLTIEIANVKSGLKVSVNDNGTGISQDLLPRVFDPFLPPRK